MFTDAGTGELGVHTFLSVGIEGERRIDRLRLLGDIAEGATHSKRTC
jgi:hypothetical protein